MALFGESRLLPSRSLPERALYHLLGVADPAHWLHFQDFVRALDAWDATGWRPMTVLDAGSGRGDYAIYLARRYPHAQVLGVDLDPAEVHRATTMARELRVPNLTFRVGDLTTLDAAPADLIISVDVLEHIPDQPAALRNLRRLLTAGGRFYFHIPTVRTRPVILSRWLDSFHEWAEAEHVAEEQTATSFADAVRGAGFGVQATRATFGRWTGELACSLFALGHRNTLAHRVLQAGLALPCRALAALDRLPSRVRYAVAVWGRA